MYTFLSLSTCPAHPLNQSYRRARHVVEHDQVNFPNVKALFTDTGGHQCIEATLLESLHYLQLILLGETLFALCPSLAYERHGAYVWSLVVQTGDQFRHTVSELAEDDHPGLPVLLFRPLEVQPRHIQQLIHLGMRGLG